MVKLPLRYGLAAFMLWLAACGTSSAQPSSEPVQRDHFIYYFDSPHYIETADSVLNDARARLEALLRDTLDYKPEVHLVKDLGRFTALIGGGFPDWGAAAAVPHRGRIVIKSPDHFNLNRGLGEMLAHEYAHLALDHRVGLGLAPRWLHEGLAMTVSREWSWSDNLAMSKAAVFGQVIPLRDVDRLNRFNAGKAHVAYAESYLAVTYLFEGYGPEAANLLLDVLASGGSVDEALMASTGSNYDDFEAEFRLFVLKRFNIVTLFMDTIWLWLALAVVVIVGAILQFRRRRKYYKQWEEQERLHSTDFDYGDPENPERTDDEDEPWRR
ncbi:MAG TPA: hypothetical protein VMY05_07700 [Acidobacteriota bacterium]|nr:hypothetical protein [Acidobacteriota bacterium]